MVQLRITFERAEADRLEKERKEKELAEERVVAKIPQPARDNSDRIQSKLADAFGTNSIK